MGTPRHWLMKSEPESYSIDDLKRDKRASWDGVRNYQARNFMREMQIGDLVLFHHSGSDSPEGPGIAGIAKVCKTAYPDSTALDPKDDHFDPKATRDNPIWLMVDIEFVERFGRVITMNELRASSALKDMPLLKRGQRLSVQPVTPGQFKAVQKLSDQA